MVGWENCTSFNTPAKSQNSGSGVNEQTWLVVASAVWFRPGEAEEMGRMKAMGWAQ
jgi:hypothetical protein